MTDDPLAVFLRDCVHRTYVIGRWDCGLMCAEWVRLCRGVDPAAEWRGRYKTEIGLARLLKRRGGIVAHFDQCLTAAGARRTGAPERGDIAIIEGPHWPVGGIVTGTNVVACAWSGIISRRRDLAPILAAWSV